jgi:hypothetical protein
LTAPLSTEPRYAVYWAPEVHHPLWQQGCAWLGRDPCEAAVASVPARAHVAEPWRYGFHATLKAPMRLIAGSRRDEFLASVERLARRGHEFQMPALQVDWLDRFIAIRPVQPLAERSPLQQLANACVAELDHYRAPPGAEELARRLSAPLDELGENFLLRWGYPHVLQRWRFHMTLSARFDDPRCGAAQAMYREAQAWFAKALAAPLATESICVFEQAGTDQMFHLVHRFGLGD